MSSKPKAASNTKPAASRQKQAVQNNQKAATSDPRMAAAAQSREQARAQRQAQARATAEAARRKANIRRIGIVGALVVVLLGVIGALVYNAANKPGQLVDAQPSRPHVQAGQPHPEYTTDPPTSGPHVGAVPEFKVYSQPITKELQVHGLEDGGVILNYKPGLDKNTVSRLEALATSYIEKGDSSDPGASNVRHPNRILVSPYQFKDPSDTIVLTSWRHIQRFSQYDEAAMRRFIDEYIGIDQHVASEQSGTIPGMTGP